jgi:hypothetical protein
MPCAPALDLTPQGYIVTGTCTYADDGVSPLGGKPRCVARFAPSQVVDGSCFSLGACEAFRERVLRVFGPGGSRSLVERGEAPLPYMPPDLVVDDEPGPPGLASRVATFCREGLGIKPPRPR